MRWNESGTKRARIGDSSLSHRVYRKISRSRGCRITRSSFAAANKSIHSHSIIMAASQTIARVSQARTAHGRRQMSLRQACGELEANKAGCYCVLAIRGGDAAVTNSTASSVAVPSGVGIDILNGTSTRVPAIGASQTSMLRWAAMYLIAARSGM